MMLIYYFVEYIIFTTTIFWCKFQNNVVLCVYISIWIEEKVDVTTYDYVYLSFHTCTSECFVYSVSPVGGSRMATCTYVD